MGGSGSGNTSNKRKAFQNAHLAWADQTPEGRVGEAKRTPKNAFDPLKGKDISFIPEMIIAKALQKRKGKQEEVYLIRWTGYSEEHDTYEPLENLAGFEDLVGAFNEVRYNFI